ncbi:hypothetical protein [Aquitalea sp. USM4]|uniref:hypothetical protein n=1 Tax=Aquitalea sp. USM4 TaxID=1590041 RepID=UPI00103BCDEF|nr:hypothetical protein [Aquitalea sp. USM4]
MSLHDNLKDLTMKFNVKIHATDAEIIGSIVSEENKCVDNAAFYIYRDGEYIDQQWYSEENSIKYAHHGIEGIYRIQGFVKDENGEIFQKLSGETPVFGDVISLSEFSEKVSKAQKPMPLHVSAGEYNFHCLYAPHPSSSIFVLLTAAVDRDKMPPPYFNRWGWKEQFPGKVFCISDPTLCLDPTISIGWYLGNQEHDATADMADLVKVLAGSVGVSEGNVITYGSSAGGFAAIMLGTYLDDAISVAINPQTDILKFSQQHVDKLLSTCFELTSFDERRFKERTNIAERLKIKSTRIILAQNVLDSHHWVNHYLPLAEQIDLPMAVSGFSKNKNYYSIIYRDSNGHAPETPEVFDELLGKIKSLLLKGV